MSCLEAQKMSTGYTCISADLFWFDGVTHIKGNTLIRCLLQFSHEDIICYFNFYKTLQREEEKKKIQWLHMLLNLCNINTCANSKTDCEPVHSLPQAFGASCLPMSTISKQTPCFLTLCLWLQIFWISYDFWSAMCKWYGRVLSSSILYLRFVDIQHVGMWDQPLAIVATSFHSWIFHHHS